jgi:phosphoribosylformylglycinamidine synthase
VLDNFNDRMTLSYANEGDVIVLIGEQKNCIGSSEYLHKLKGVEYSPAPNFDLDEEFKVQALVTDLIKQKLINSAHDISEGGLAVTLLEKGFYNNLGFDIAAKPETRNDSYWFGEAQSRVVVTVASSQISNFKSVIETVGIAFTELGTVTAGDIKVNGESWGSIVDWKEKYDTAIEKLLNA